MLNTKTSVYLFAFICYSNLFCLHYSLFERFEIISITGCDLGGVYRHIGSKGYAKQLKNLLERSGVCGQFFFCNLGAANCPEAIERQVPDELWGILPEDLEPGYIAIVRKEGKRGTRIMLWCGDGSVSLDELRQKLLCLDDVIGDEGTNSAKQEAYGLRQAEQRASEETVYFSILQQAALESACMWTQAELVSLLERAFDTLGESDVPAKQLPNPTETMKLYFRRLESGRYTYADMFWEKAEYQLGNLPPTLRLDVSLHVEACLRVISAEAEKAGRAAERELEKAARLERFASGYASKSRPIQERIGELEEELNKLREQARAIQDAEQICSGRINARLADIDGHEAEEKIVRSIVRSPSAQNLVLIFGIEGGLPGLM